LQVGDAEGLFRLLDVAGEGVIEMEEFCLGCSRLRGPAKALEVGLLRFELNRLATRFVELETSIDTHMLALRKSHVIELDETKTGHPRQRNVEGDIIWMR